MRTMFFWMNVGRNELCPCGSGLKFKKCCLDKPYQPSAELLADFALGQERLKESPVPYYDPPPGLKLPRLARAIPYIALALGQQIR